MTTPDTPAPVDGLVERLIEAVQLTDRNWKREHVTVRRWVGKAASELAAARQRIAEMEGVLTACADDLEAELKDRYGDPPPTLHHDTVRRYDRDMATVHEARAVLDAPDARRPSPYR